MDCQAGLLPILQRWVWRAHCSQSSPEAENNLQPDHRPTQERNYKKDAGAQQPALSRIHDSITGSDRKARKGDCGRKCPSHGKDYRANLWHQSLQSARSVGLQIRQGVQQRSRDRSQSKIFQCHPASAGEPCWRWSSDSGSARYIRNAGGRPQRCRPDRCRHGSDLCQQPDPNRPWHDCNVAQRPGKAHEKWGVD